MLSRPKAIDLAVLEAERLKNSGTWVCIDQSVKNIVRLEWGTIHTNGQEERAICSRRYEDRMFNGQSFVDVGPIEVHP